MYPSAANTPLRSDLYPPLSLRLPVLASPLPVARVPTTVRFCLYLAKLTTLPWFRRVAYRHAAHGISIHRNISDIERRFAECASTPIDGKQFIIQGQPKPKPRLAPTVLRSSTDAVDHCFPPLRLVTSLASSSSCVPPLLFQLLVALLPTAILPF